MSSKELTVGQSSQYVGPYRLEKTLGKGQTGRSLLNYLGSLQHGRQDVRILNHDIFRSHGLILIPAVSPLIVRGFILLQPS